MEIDWRGKGADETGVVSGFDAAFLRGKLNGSCKRNGNLKPRAEVVAVDPCYFRPTEVETFLGDASKARQKFGRTPRISFEEMVREDLALAARDEVCRREGFKVYDYHK
ncbi:GDP-mannose 4,6-dehydratase [Desulfocurvibacter africanus]|uniref:GDP-mannose 4,6-dehydratase n=1 Tax=Desulfocurvibacter africanus TaxID=873 RepID=UPI002FD970CD